MKKIENNTTIEIMKLYGTILVLILLLPVSHIYADQILLDDDFSQGATWSNNQTIKTVKGRLVLFSKSDPIRIWQPVNLVNGRISVDIWTKGSGESWFGIIYRVQDDRNYYYTLFTHSGGFRNGKVVNGSAFELKNPLTRVRGLAERGMSHIEIITKGNEVKLYINDRFITAFEDEEFSSGGAGFYSDVETQAIFDNLRITTSY